MKKKVKKSFNSVKMSKDVEKKIMDETVDKRVVKNYKLRWGLMLCLVILGITFKSEIVIAAREIVSLIWERGILITSNGNGYRVFEDVKGVKYNEIPSTYMVGKEFETTVEEVEKILGIKLLKYDKASSNNVYCTFLPVIEKHSERKGKIDRVYLRQLNFYTNYGYSELLGLDYGYYLRTEIISSEADEFTKLDFLEELNTMGGKNMLEEYYSNNLQTKVFIYNYDYKPSWVEVEALFVYKDIRYEITGVFEKDVPLDDLKDILENMHL